MREDLLEKPEESGLKKELILKEEYEVAEE